MSEVGPIVTEQPGSEQPEETEVVPGPSGTIAPSGTIVPSGNPNGEWAASLNPCCHPCSLLKVIFCWDCVAMEIAGYLGKNACFHCCCTGDPLCLGFPFFGPCLRSEMRKQHGIRGSFCEDCLCWICCTCCVMTQMAAETKVGTKVKQDNA